MCSFVAFNIKEHHTITQPQLVPLISTYMGIVFKELPHTNYHQKNMIYWIDIQLNADLRALWNIFVVNGR